MLSPQTFSRMVKVLKFNKVVFDFQKKRTIETLLKNFYDLNIEVFQENSLLKLLTNKIFSGYKFAKNLKNAKSFLH